MAASPAAILPKTTFKDFFRSSNSEPTLAIPATPAAIATIIPSRPNPALVAPFMLAAIPPPAAPNAAAPFADVTLSFPSI